MCPCHKSTLFSRNKQNCTLQHIVYFLLSTSTNCWQRSETLAPIIDSHYLLPKFLRGLLNKRWWKTLVFILLTESTAENGKFSQWSYNNKMLLSVRKFWHFIAGVILFLIYGNHPTCAKLVVLFVMQQQWISNKQDYYIFIY